MSTVTDDVNIEFYRHFYDDMAEKSDQFISDHWSTTGWIEGRFPNLPSLIQDFAQRGISLPIGFSDDRYLELNPDVGEIVKKPWQASVHFLFSGQKEGRPIGTPETIREYNKTPDEQAAAVEKLSISYALSSWPLVSVITVNMTGLPHLPVLIDCLKSQTYQNFEFIFVDNASTDSSIDYIRNNFFGAIILPQSSNRGFAEANNIGLREARGELIALLNNDTMPSPFWLEELVFCMQRNANAAAVTSKVLFWTKYLRFTLTSAEAFSLQQEQLTRSLSYKKIFYDGTLDIDGNIAAVDRAGTAGSGYKLELTVPLEPGGICLSATKANNAALIIEVNAKKFNFNAQCGFVEFVFQPDANDSRLAKHVINNVGSIRPTELESADRGFGEFDIGQYAVEERVPLLCGCAVLIRRDALLGLPLFANDFIAYYEDSELSLRLLGNGFDIYYCPSAVVFHRHSATSKEHSPFWALHVTRNKLVYQYILTPTERRLAFFHERMMFLNHYCNWLSTHIDIIKPEEKVLLSVLPDVMSQLPSLREKVDNGTIVAKELRRIGLFNPYWNTLGGGEAHALFIADYIGQFGVVELIAIEDFNIDQLCKYFGKSNSKYVKRLLKLLTPEITAEYDIFINSCYMNECPSKAALSYYAVSFPSRSPSLDFLRSYTFLANSTYTLSWMQRYWGAGVKATLVEPCVSDRFFGYSEQGHPKEKMFLSIGRFFSTGHTKNQLLIVEAFIAALTMVGDNATGWKLGLAGSVGDHDYFSKVISLSSGQPIEIFPNASIEQIESLYEDALVYVHAAGLGKDAESEPENFEHFGMTVAEAVANGCLPIVYKFGGPADIVNAHGVGQTFSDVDDLSAKMASVMNGELRTPSPSSIAAIGNRFSAQSRRLDLETVLLPSLDQMKRHIGGAANSTV